MPKNKIVYQKQGSSVGDSDTALSQNNLQQYMMRELENESTTQQRQRGLSSTNFIKVNRPMSQQSPPLAIEDCSQTFSEVNDPQLRAELQTIQDFATRKEIRQFERKLHSNFGIGSTLSNTTVRQSKLKLGQQTTAVTAVRQQDQPRQQQQQLRDIQTLDTTTRTRTSAAKRPMTTKHQWTTESSGSACFTS